MSIEEQLVRVSGQLTALGERLLKLDEKVDDAAVKREEQDERLTQIEERLETVERATANGLFDWVRQHWQIVLALSVPVPFLLTAITVGVWSMQRDEITAFVREEFILSALRDEEIIRVIREEIRKAEHNDRVLFQPLGLSFVKSPVTQGGKATYVLVAKRTPVGASCEYRGMVPIFTDELGRTLTSRHESRNRQFGEEMVRTELELDVPMGLLPGRVVVVLQIDYGDCGSDETYPVAFQLLPAAPGP